MPRDQVTPTHTVRQLKDEIADEIREELQPRLIKLLSPELTERLLDEVCPPIGTRVAAKQAQRAKLMLTGAGG